MRGSNPAAAANVARMSENSPRPKRVSPALAASRWPKRCMRAAKMPAATFSTIESTAAAATGLDREPKGEEKDGGEGIPEREHEVLDARSSLRLSEDQADHESSDGYGDPDFLGHPGDEDGDAHEENSQQLVIFGPHEAADPMSAETRQQEQGGEEGEGPPEQE